MSAQTLLVAHRQIGLVGEHAPARHQVHLPKPLTVRHIHAVGHRRVTVAPPAPVGRIRGLINAVEHRHPGLRRISRPCGSHVDNPIGGSRAVHRRGRGFHHFHLVNVLHRKVRPPNLAQIPTQQRQAVKQHLNTAAHTVTVSTAAANADLTVQDRHTRSLGHQPFQVEDVCTFDQIRFQHRHRDRLLRNGGPTDARRDHSLRQGFGVGQHDHLHILVSSECLAVECLRVKPHKSKSHRAGSVAIHRLCWT